MVEEIADEVSVSVDAGADTRSIVEVERRDVAVSVSRDEMVATEGVSTAGSTNGTVGEVGIDDEESNDMDEVSSMILDVLDCAGVEVESSLLAVPSEVDELPDMDVRDEASPKVLAKLGEALDSPLIVSSDDALSETDAVLEAELICDTELKLATDSKDVPLDRESAPESVPETIVVLT